MGHVSWACRIRRAEAEHERGLALLCHLARRCRLLRLRILWLRLHLALHLRLRRLLRLRLLILDRRPELALGGRYRWDTRSAKIDI